MGRAAAVEGNAQEGRTGPAFVWADHTAPPRLYVRRPTCPRGLGRNQRLRRRPGQPRPEDYFEMTRVGARRASGVDPGAVERRHRGRPLLGMPAGNDALEVVEAGGEVHGEAVPDHPAVHLVPKGGPLLAILPDPPETAI